MEEKTNDKKALIMLLLPSAFVIGVMILIFRNFSTK